MDNPIEIGNLDKLTSIRAFTRVVQHGSFAAAARELRLSRSAVSKYVIELEQALGAQLLVRTTRSASPTENGQAYYERCLAILADLEEADLAVARLQSEPRGLLRVNAPMSFGTLHLGRAVADFMERYPALQIMLVLSDQQIDPVQEGFDVTLRIADLPSSSLIARKIAPALRVRCAAPEISIYAIYPQTRHLSVKVRVFIDFLAERFGGPPYWDLVK